MWCFRVFDLEARQYANAAAIDYSTNQHKLVRILSRVLRLRQVDAPTGLLPRPLTIGI